jgi:hypothetical protein
LTTLSVYLGLVLVGGAPQVFAQAALTRDFDIKNEIEFKDDLDNKPDDEKGLEEYTLALEDLFLLAKDFSAKNSEKLRDNKYEFDCYVSHNGRGVSCSGGSGLYWGGFIPTLEKIHKAFPHVSDKDKEQVKVNLILTDKEFSLKTVLFQSSNEQAEQYYNFYDGGLSRIKLQQLNNSHSIIYQNTTLSFENNQVFIVTRLARASIDELLAENVAR